MLLTAPSEAPAAAAGPRAAALLVDGRQHSPASAAEPGGDDILESWRRGRALQQARPDNPSVP